MTFFFSLGWPRLPQVVSGSLKGGSRMAGRAGNQTAVPCISLGLRKQALKQLSYPANPHLMGKVNGHYQ